MTINPDLKEVYGPCVYEIKKEKDFLGDYRDSLWCAKHPPAAENYPYVFGRSFTRSWYAYRCQFSTGVEWALIEKEWGNVNHN